MSKTIKQLLDNLSNEDPDTVLEVLMRYGVESGDLVQRFADVLSDNADDLEEYFHDPEEEEDY